MKSTFLYLKKDMRRSRLELNCPGCGEITFLRRDPVYEGFIKTGESLSCSSCGKKFELEESIPFKKDTSRTIFAIEDRQDSKQLFDQSEKQCVCRYCINYIINPFTQWCNIKKKEVEATDTCENFRKKENISDEK